MPLLNHSPAIGSPQAIFEFLLTRNMGINRGVLAFTDETRYANEHIQWLWEQFMVRIA